MTAPPPAVYDADVDEMAAGQLAVLAEARRRLTAHYAWAPDVAAAVAGVLDEYAEEVADTEEDW